MGLEKYWSKRNFERTPEPHGEVEASTDALRFVIQKHEASHLHYDFRLEIAGTLKSWAIPKGPSLDPGEKRLAVEVEDHPLSYGNFEGTIPAGEYGGGTVMLWDRGRFIPEGDPAAGYRKGRLKFRLEGEKLEGDWALVRMASRGEKRTNWLLVKSDDEYAREGDGAGITERRTESVLTGRQMEEIEAGKKARQVTRGATAAKAKAATATKPAAKKAAGRSGQAEKSARSKQAQTREVAAKGSKSSSLVRTPSARVAKKSGSNSKSSAPTAKAPRRGRTALPAFIAPQLATLVDRAPAAGEWLAEMKFDGYRLLARLDKQQCRLWTRNEKEWTMRLPELAAELAALPVQDAWLDGEVIAVDAEGRSDFSLLQQAFGKAGRRDIRLLFYAFDLLFLDGHDLRGLPQRERKQLLHELLAGHGGMVRYSEHLEGHAEEAHRHACQHGEEGIILKRADAPYSSERSANWLKLKCGQRQEFVIGGYTDPEGTRKEFGALLVGYYTAAGEFVYAGRVGTGFNSALLAELGPQLRRRERKTPAFAVPPARAEIKGAHWVAPELVCDLRFAGWTRLDRLRQPAFLGLREDKPASSVRREQASAPPRRSEGRAEEDSATFEAASAALQRDTERAGDGAAEAVAAPARPGTTRGKARAAARHAAAEAPATQVAPPDEAAPQRQGDGAVGPVVAGVAISNASRVIFPEASLTKLDVARYYEQVADWLLPQLKDRPLTLVRCPQGLKHACFFQRHLTDSLPASLQPVLVPEDEDTATAMTADSLTAVVDLVQMGVLELHTWGARRDRLDRPDRMIFDLDPAPDVQWASFVACTRIVRELLADFGLPAFLKSTGGKGMHVEVPLRREHDWETVKEVSQAIAQLLAQQLPDWFIAKAAKKERGGRVFIDYLRNAQGATAVAAFSTRARAGAPVALPLHWDELDETPPGTWTLRNVPQRLAQQKQDPWRDYEASRVTLGKGLLLKLGLDDA
ncbi:MAG: ATP-dependent ligase protein [Moraxellaceae bacterium]|nr:ATP-dependent ligase protein [Moraxellaceae bacterium]